MKKIICSFIFTLMMAFTVTGVQADELKVSSFNLELSYGQHDENVMKIKEAIVDNSDLLTEEMRRNVNLSDSQLTIDNIEIDKIGEQTIIARLELSYFDRTILGISNVVARIDIDIEDRIAPELLLKSYSTTTIELGDEFDPMDLVEEVSDNRDSAEDIDLYYEGTFDVDSTGDYEVTYYAQDSSGNVTSVVHNFKVRMEQIRYIYYSGGSANQITDDFYEVGHQYLGDEFIKLEGIPLYTQDTDYTYIKSGSGTCGSTISRYGCALVSFAMVGHSLNDEITVESVNDLGYSNSGCYFGFYSAAAYYGLDFTKLNVPYKTTEAKNILRGMLREGHPAIIELKTYSTGATHFVVVYSYQRQDNWETFFVKNPTNGNYDSLENLLKTKYISKIYYLR